MESTMMVIRINGKEYNILREIVKRFFMGTHLITSMRIMDIEHPHTFALFIEHLSEYEGNEDTIPESWDEVIVEFQQFLVCHARLVFDDLA